MVDDITLYCGHCGHKSFFELEAEYTHYEHDVRIEDPTQSCAHASWRLLKCKFCVKPTLQYNESYSYYNPNEDEDISGYTSTILYPMEVKLEASRPIEGMPADMKKVFNEACLIFDNSPRASAALLRLALQMLCRHKGVNGYNLKLDIKKIVEKDTPSEVQKAMDIIRLTGNNAVHPGEIDPNETVHQGEIDLNENRDDVLFLFDLLNLATKELWVRSNKIDEAHKKLIEEERIRNESKHKPSSNNT